MRNSKKNSIRFLWMSFILFFYATSSSVVQSAPLSMEEVKGYLEGYEWNLNSVKFLISSEDVDLVLMQIIADPQPMLNYYRFRALETLRLFPNERVANFLDQYLRKEHQVPHLRRALDSFTNNFKRTHTQKVEEIAARFLTHQNPGMRIAAANSLRQLNTSQANALIEKQLKEEKQDWVRQRMR